MATNEGRGEVQVLRTSTLSLKWTSVMVPGSAWLNESDIFEFNGAEWKLRAWTHLTGQFNRIILLGKVFGACCRRPLQVSVEVTLEGEILKPLSHTMEISRDCSLGYSNIWQKGEVELRRAIPAFHSCRPLTFHVVLKTEGDTSLAEAESIGESPPLAASNSVQFRNSPCQESLVQDFSRMLEDQDSSTDVEFQFPDQGQSTRAHAVVVSARSNVLAAMLSSDMVEGRTRVVKIPNMEHGVFQHFLRYLYSGTLPELTVELALNLFEGGDQYAVTGLVRICTEYLRLNLTVQNACDVLVIADSHQHAELKEAVVEYMVDKRVPRTSDRWQEFCQAHPMLAIGVYDRLCPQ